MAANLRIENTIDLLSAKPGIGELIDKFRPADPSRGLLEDGYNSRTGRANLTNYSGSPSTVDAAHELTPRELQSTRLGYALCSRQSLPHS